MGVRHPAIGEENFPRRGNGVLSLFTAAYLAIVACRSEAAQPHSTLQINGSGFCHIFRSPYLPLKPPAHNFIADLACRQRLLDRVANAVSSFLRLVSSVARRGKTMECGFAESSK
jgi:hypothetical protein